MESTYLCYCFVHNAFSDDVGSVYDFLCEHAHRTPLDARRCPSARDEWSDIANTMEMAVYDANLAIEILPLCDGNELPFCKYCEDTQRLISIGGRDAGPCWCVERITTELYTHIDFVLEWPAFEVYLASDIADDEYAPDEYLATDFADDESAPDASRSDQS